MHDVVAAIWSPAPELVEVLSALPGVTRLEWNASAGVDQGPYAGRGNADACVVATTADASALVATLDAHAGEVWAWRVTRTRRKAYDREWPDGEVSPGVKMVSLMRRNPDLSHDEFAEHWAERHTPLALRHHVGLWCYTQSVVDAVLTPGRGDADAIDGIAELHFHTREDFEERFFDSDDGAAVIMADVARFMAGAGRGTALMAETVLRT